MLQQLSHHAGPLTSHPSNLERPVPPSSTFSPDAAVFASIALCRLFSGQPSRFLRSEMASTRAAAPLRSALRIALSRPASAAPFRATPAIRSRHPVILHARSFQTIGVRWEKSAAGEAPTEPKKWDFDMVWVDTALRGTGRTCLRLVIGEGGLRDEARKLAADR